MDETNPLDALDDQPGGAERNPLDELDEPQGGPQWSGDQLLGPGGRVIYDGRAPAVLNTAYTMDSALSQVPDETIPVETEAAGGYTPKQIESWRETLGAVSPTIGARIESKLAGAQEYGARSAYGSARTAYWRSMVLPRAAAEAKDAGINLIEHPDVVDNAKRLGVSPDFFASRADDFQGMSEQELSDFQARQREKMADAQAKAETGAGRRRLAAQVSAGVRPDMPEWSPQSIAFDAMTSVPDLLIGVGGTVAGGPAVGLAAMMTSIAPEEWSAAKNQGLDDKRAATYATLSTLAQGAPELPVLRIVSGGAAGRSVLRKLVGETLAESAPGKVAGTALTQGVSQAIIQGLQESLDAGFIDRDTSLKEALSRIGRAGIMGTAMGAPIGALHASMSRAPRAPREAPAARREPTIGTLPDIAPRVEPQIAPVERPAAAASPAAEPPAPGEGQAIAAPSAPAEAVDTRAALQALQDKTISPPQMEHLEGLGLARRNDLGVPFMLPAGRRALVDLQKQPEATETTPVKTPVATGEPAEELPDLAQRLGSDQGLRAELDRMKTETGWAQKGGALLRNEETGVVKGRTTWIPNAQWWKERPKGLKEAEVHAAVDKALAGQKLSVPERRMVQFMVDVHDERAQMEGVHAQIEAAVPAAERQAAGPDADSLLHLATRAAEHDQGATTAALDSWDDDHPATLTRVHGALQDIIARGQQAQAEGPRHAEARAGVPAQAPARGADLFGQDTRTAQALADEQRRRDLARSPGREVSLETGRPDDLFSQARQQVDFTDQLKQARRETETAPTDAQKEAGNYAKGEVSFAGMTLAIENPKGSTRTGVKRTGEHWSRQMAHDYGYVKRTEGADGDPVDVFLTGKPDTGKVFVINQVDPTTGKFDEVKAVLGAATGEEAQAVYRANYPKGWKGLGSIVEMPTERFRHWAGSEDASKPAPTGERRVDVAHRKAVAAMTPEELRKDLLTHELTGIPNRRAYQEAARLPVQVSVDANSLKFINDAGGHEAGDHVLKAIATALHEETQHAYHLRGDEFAVQAHSQEEAERVLASVKDRLARATVELVAPDGRRMTVKGIGIAHGAGETLEAADRNLQREKARQEAAGLRAPRGQQPPGTTLAAAQGRLPSEEDHAAPAVARTRKPASKATTVLQDVGEKIGGARKDVFAERGMELKDLDSMSDAEAATLVSKKNVWAPDYAAQIEAGQEPLAAALSKVLYDKLAATPRKNTPEGRRQYIQAMRAVREHLGGAKTVAEVRQAEDKIADAVGFGVQARSRGSSPQASDTFFSIIRGRRSTLRVGYNEERAARELIEKGFPNQEAYHARFEIKQASGENLTDQGRAAVMEQAQKVGTPLSEELLKQGLYRVQQKNGKAVGYSHTKEGAEELARKFYSELKGAKGEGELPERPHLDKLERTGLPTTRERDVKSEDFLHDFGFRGIEFGNWAAGDERQKLVNLAYDGLHDMASTLHVPPQALSLNGTLGLAFGARGTGRAAAHYEPGKLVINMTKLSGAGSLAHEWAHAFDHYMGELDRPDAYKTEARGATGWYGRPTVKTHEMLRPELKAAWKDVLKALFQRDRTQADMVRMRELDLENFKANLQRGKEQLARHEARPADQHDPQYVKRMAEYLSATERRITAAEEGLIKARGEPEQPGTYGKVDSSYFEQARQLSGKSGAKGYWARPTEMWARAFESFVFDKLGEAGAKSEYLVHGVEGDRYSPPTYKGNPYPKEERPAINTAIQNLVDALQTRPGKEGLPTLYARREGPGPGLERPDVDRAVRAAVRDSGMRAAPDFPHVEVHEDYTTLPPDLRERVIRDGSQETAGAVYDPQTGAIHMIADNLGTPREAVETLWHEAVGHHGLRLIMDADRYAHTMDGIWNAMPDRVRQTAERNGLDVGELAQRRMAAEEVIAYAAGQHLAGTAIDKPLRPFWQRALNAVRAFFARVTGKPFTDDRAIAGIIAESKRALESGSGLQRMGALAASQRAATFYSPVERAVTASKQGKASAEQWLAMIKKTPGVKPDEISWLGLEPWLKSHDGPVTREALADYVRANKLELEETHYGGLDKARTEAEIAQTHHAEALRAMGAEVEINPDGSLQSVTVRSGRRGEAIYSPDDSGWEAVKGTRHALEEMPLQMRVHLEALREASEHVNREFAEEENFGSRTRGPQYEEFTLPGGENYHEALIRLPIPGDYPGRRDNPLGSDVFQSSHWQERNVLAHVRFKDRVDAEGKKTLFLEELQSDWHQQGRERGYASPERLLTPSEHNRLLAERDGLNIERERLSEERDPVTNAMVEEARWHELSRRVEEIGARLEASYRSNAVPQAPFKTSWPMLIMKRMIRAAAEAGHDRIAWTTGEQQAERYNLSKRVVIEHHKTADGNYWVHALDATTMRSLHEATLPADKLAGLVGQDIARKIVNEEGVALQPTSVDQELKTRGRALQAFRETSGHWRLRFEDGSDMGTWSTKASAEGDMKRMNDRLTEPARKRLTGDDLRMGGEGMRGFYDDILPRETGKLIKKYGAEVREARIPVDVTGMVHERGRPEAVIQLEEATGLERWGIRHAGGHESGVYLSKADAERALFNLQSVYDAGPPHFQAHGFDITPEMREQALSQGFPMFWKKPSQQTLGRKAGQGPGWYEAVRRAVMYLHSNPVTRDMRKLINPSKLSDEAKRTAVIARAALGNLAHQTFETQEALEKFSRQIDRLPPVEQLEMMDRIEHGLPQAIGEYQPVADKLRNLLDTTRDQVRALGVGALDNFIENYFPHYWSKPDQAQRMIATIMGRRPLRGPASFLKMRTIPTIKEGMDAGLTPLTINPLVMTLLKVREMQRFVSGVKMMQSFKDAGLAQFLRSGKPMPEGWAEIKDNIARVRQWSEEEQGFIERGRYIMPEDGARLINNHLGRSAIADFAPAQIIRVGANALNATQLGWSAWHLGFTTLDAAISKNSLAMERLAHGEVGRAAAAFAEGLTPAAPVMNLRRGFQLMKAYANPSGATPQMLRIVQALEIAGGRAQMDRYYMASHGVSPFRGAGVRSLAGDIRTALKGPQPVRQVGRAVANFPAEYAVSAYRELQGMTKTMPLLQVPFEIAGRFARMSTAWIMEHVVPLQKLGVFSDMAQDYLRRNPTATSDQIARAMQSAWDSVDNRLGEMVYDNLFWNRTAKDTAHLAVRAVGWNLGTIREIGGAPIDALAVIDKLAREGKITADDLGHKIPYVLAMTLTTAMLGATINYLFTGEGPQELKDYFFPRTGGTTTRGTPQRLSLPSYVKDVYEYSQRPGITIANKLNPIWSTLADIWRNEDFYGTPISEPEAGGWAQAWERGAFALRQATPFAIQGSRQIAGSEKPGFAGGVKRVLPFVGVTPAPGYVTSPDQIARRERYEAEDKYSRDLKYKLNRAITSHADKDTIKALTQEYVQSRRRVMELKVETQKDKAKAAAARHKNSISMRQQGYPATAALIASLPLEPDRQAREYFRAQG